jgi:hypothetical protein
VAILFFIPSHTWSMGVILGQTKEQLKLKYEVSVYDHGTGRVTVTIALADEGRLKPVRSVDLKFPSKDTFQDGVHMVDLSLSLATTKKDGKLVASVHLKKEWAEQAQLWLSTSYLDGKTLALTSYHHVIPIAKYMKNAPATPPRPARAAAPDAESAPPAAAAPARDYR